MNDTEKVEIQSAKRKRAQIQRQVSLLVSMIAAVAATAVMVFSVSNFSVYKFSDSKFPRDQIDTVKAEFSVIDNRIEDLAQRYRQHDSVLKAFLDVVNQVNQDPQSLDAAKYMVQLKKLSADIKAIQTALGSDIERSLSVPLLRKDLAQLEIQLKERTATASKDIDRIYDQNKWFLGLMGTMALGLLGLVVSNFLQFRKDDS